MLLCVDFNKHQLIEKYRAMYNLNWSADVGDDAWELADSWVNTRQIHPDDVPQLGLLNSEQRDHMLDRSLFASLSSLKKLPDYALM